MKFNNQKILFFSLILLVLVLPNQVKCIDESADLIKPNSEEGIEKNIPSLIDLNKIPDFIPYKKENNDSPEVTISFMEKPLKISVEAPVDIKKTKPGDMFSAKVLQDFYIPFNTPYLVIPKGSWLYGKISLVRRPNLIKKTGDLTIHLNEIVTPVGDFALLNTDLELKQGIIPGIKLSQPLDSEINNNSDLVRLSENLELKNLSEIFSGKLFAVSSQETNGSLYTGQEFHILINKQLNIANLK